MIAGYQGDELLRTLLADASCIMNVTEVRDLI